MQDGLDGTDREWFNRLPSSVFVVGAAAAREHNDYGATIVRSTWVLPS